jgi:hypothetical protein
MYVTPELPTTVFGGALGEIGRRGDRCAADLGGEAIALLSWPSIAYTVHAQS